MAKTKRTRRNFMSELMAEHVRMPGCPQMIVTRGWAVVFFRDELGHDPKARGFASLDYLIFGGCRPTVNEPLSDLSSPEVLSVLALMKSHAA